MGTPDTRVIPARAGTVNLKLVSTNDGSPLYPDLCKNYGEFCWITNFTQQNHQVQCKANNNFKFRYALVTYLQEDTHLVVRNGSHAVVETFESVLQTYLITTPNFTVFESTRRVSYDSGYVEWRNTYTGCTLIEAHFVGINDPTPPDYPDFPHPPDPPTPPNPPEDSDSFPESSSESAPTSVLIVRSGGLIVRSGELIVRA